MKANSGHALHWLKLADQSKGRLVGEFFRIILTIARVQVQRQITRMDYVGKDCENITLPQRQQLFLVGEVWGPRSRQYGDKGTWWSPLYEDLCSSNSAIWAAKCLYFLSQTPMPPLVVRVSLLENKWKFHVCPSLFLKNFISSSYNFCESLIFFKTYLVENIF